MRESTNTRKIWIAFWVFALIAGFFLLTEHKAHLLGFYAEHEAHILGSLPYLLLLLCPLMHIFMHGGGHGHEGHEKSHGHHGHERKE
ncbi:MAG: DUF2933 domain-containing protein [Thermodesulfobacteriota bacterium]